MADTGMKKIGCVIAYRKGHTNYGTSLVGYSLVRKLRELGFDIEIINYVKRLTLFEKLRYLANAFMCGGLRKLLIRRRVGDAINENSDYGEGLRKRTEVVEAYKSRKLEPLFRQYVGFKSLREGSVKYRAIVVGSDQVWTPMSLPNKYFNLLFAADQVRKVAYASSFGVSEIPWFQRKATGKYLDRFYRIGVREVRGKEIVEELSKKEAKVVADPTLLLSASEWEEEARESRFGSGDPYIFVYLLGPNQDGRKAARELKQRTGLRIITLKHMDEYVAEDETFGDEWPYDVDPNDFVRLISKASYVITDSFHCSAFSIQFHRRFMTFYRFRQGSSQGRNSRIDSLFSVLGISRDRIYSGDVGHIDDEVDWKEVDKRLKTLRQDSIGFLKEALDWNEEGKD